jgi:hypothetical protein
VSENCCIFTQRFCTQSGNYVIGRMKLQKGVLSVVYYDMNGVVYTNNDIAFPSCATNFINAVIDIVDVSCTSNEDVLRTNLTLSTLAGLQNGTKIKLTALSNNNELIQSVSANTPTGAFTISSSNGIDIDIEIIDINLMASTIVFGIKFQDLACAISNIYTVSVIDITNAVPSWGLGITSQDIIIKP